MTEPALLRMAAGLALVVGVILVGAWLARRAGLLQRAPVHVLRQIDHLSLGPRTGLAVVEIQDTWLVLGVTSGQITRLHSLPAAPVAARAESAFAATLNRLRLCRQPAACPSAVS